MNVIIVGGGAAGMMAAYSAAENGAQVTLYEKNEKLGKKVFITGKGRCNVTNAGDTNEFFDQVISNPKFLYSAVYGFDAFMVMELIEKYGCPLKTERGNRVFPVSDHSSDIIKAMEKAIIDKGVVIKKNRFVKDIIVTDDICKGIIIGSDQNDGSSDESVYADKVIICTGGSSYQSTGSDGYHIKKMASYGHKITELRPGLVPLVSTDNICKELMGLSLKNVSLDLYVDGKNITIERITETVMRNFLLLISFLKSIIGFCISFLLAFGIFFVILFIKCRKYLTVLNLVFGID